MQLASLIDLDALPPQVRDDVAFALERAMERHSREKAVQAVKDNPTDQEMIAFAEREYPGAPIGLSTWYPEGVSWLQETRLGLEVGQQRKRPVFLRGAKKLCIQRYCLSEAGTSPNGWAVSLFWRYVRVAKFTALDANEFEELAAPVRRWVASKYPSVTNAFLTRTNNSRAWFTPVIGGRCIELTDSQLRHIRGLREIARKTERLDEQVRRAMIRANMQERLAA